MTCTKKAKTKVSRRLVTVAAISLLLFTLFILSSCEPSAPAMNTADVTEYIEIESVVGLELDEAFAILDAAGVEYELVISYEGERGKVLDIGFEGFEKDGTLSIEKGSTVKIYGNRRVVYLTFDDGPTRDNTMAIVDILEQYGAKATFFVLGNRIGEYEDRIEYIYEKGHEIGCHSYSHDMVRDSAGYIYASPEALVSEIEKYEQKLIAVLGEEAFSQMPKLFRFPGGSYSNGRLEDAEVPTYIDAVHNKGYTIYDWTILTNDAATDTMKEDETYEEFYLRSLEASLNKAKDTSMPLILLMHDQRRTRENLCAVLDYLVEQGYSFGLLSDCPEYTFSK